MRNCRGGQWLRRGTEEKGDRYGVHKEEEERRRKKNLGLTMATKVSLQNDAREPVDRVRTPTRLNNT
ncbi:hypothetical protein C1H46_026824 [Malus baccata]|uniref:Uncharacterized protein n=1 Tax=Malus baccata TaxID=106549 RepID=A0A540LMA8_MALBA|nr:hypothetical protein C1H46_026824 [Malus baccata]